MSLVYLIQIYSTKYHGGYALQIFDFGLHRCGRLLIFLALYRRTTDLKEVLVDITVHDGRWWVLEKLNYSISCC